MPQPQRQTDCWDTTAMAQPDDTITLNVLQPSGNCIPLVVQRKDTIYQVKEKVMKVISVKRTRNRKVELINDVTHLQDADTVLQCGLNEGDSLTVVVRVVRNIPRPSPPPRPQPFSSYSSYFY